MIVTNREIYLDNSATTKVSDIVADRVYNMLVENYGNPSSLHSKGLRAQHIMENARVLIAENMGVNRNEVFFTSGGTEANNLAIIGTALKKRKTGNKIVTSSVEHSSVIEACKYLENLGFEVVYLPVDENGFVCEKNIENAVDENTILVSLMYANNEVGTIQPVDKVARIIKRKNSPALFHIDAVQTFGKIPFKNTRLKADFISISAHKIHAPKGIGAIYIKKGISITPRQFGGQQQNKIRPGTESTPLICGFGQAVSEIDYNNINLIKELNDYLKNRLSTIKGIVINSPQNALEYIVNFSVDGIKSETMLHFLEEKNIYVSSGSACTKGKQSHVLQAMGLDKKLSDTALRVSFSKYNNKQDIDFLIEGLLQGINTLARIN